MLVVCVFEVERLVHGKVAGRDPTDVTGGQVFQHAVQDMRNGSGGFFDIYVVVEHLEYRVCIVVFTVEPHDIWGGDDALVFE